MGASLRRVVSVDRPQVVGPITLSHGINEFFAIVIPPIIPLLVADFGITYGQAGFLLTVFFIMYSLFQLPAGVAADWIGKTRLLIAGLIGMTIGVFLAGLAPTYEWLLIAQAIAGISGSTFHPTGLSIISDVEVRDTQGRAMGVFAFGGTLGTLAAPLLVGGLAVAIGWRLALVGAAGLGGAMTLLVIAITVRQRTTGGASMRADGGIAIRHRLRRARRIAGMLATREIGVLCVLTLVMSLQHRAIQTFTTAYVAVEIDVSVSVANIAFFLLLAGGAVASLWAGELADRVDRVYLGIGVAFATACLVGATAFVGQLAAVLPFELLLGTVMLWFTVIGFTMYASYPVKNALISQEADAAYSGSLFGIIQTGSSLGSASGPAIFGVLATQWGLLAAFPAIAAASVVLALLFGALLLLR